MLKWVKTKRKLFRIKNKMVMKKTESLCSRKIFHNSETHKIPPTLIHKHTTSLTKQTNSRRPLTRSKMKIMTERTLRVGASLNTMMNKTTPKSTIKISKKKRRRIWEKDSAMHALMNCPARYIRLPAVCTCSALIALKITVGKKSLTMTILVI